jgi:LPS export ABC transporter permease LptG
VRPALPVIDRYILQELGSPFGLGLAIFTLFLVIDRIYHLTDLVITKGVPFHLVLQLLVFTLPSFMAQTLAMAFLVAVLLAGGRLAGDREIIAFKSAGVSIVRLFRPVLLAGLIIAALTAMLTLVVSPLANVEFQRQLYEMLRTRAVSGLKERIFNTSFGNVVIYVEDISPSQVALRGMLVSDERDPKLTRIITAREGRLITDEDSRRVTLRLLDGAVNEADVAPAAPLTLAKDETAPAGGAASAARYRYTNFSVYDMSLSVTSPFAGTNLEKPEKDLGLRALLARIGELRDDPHGRAPFETELHKRFALPLSALIFALVGFPLAVRSHRGGRSVALVGSLVILVSYYVLMTTFEGIGLRGRIPPWLAIWITNLLFAAIGVGLLVATAIEWRPRGIHLFWRLVHAVRRAAPARPRFGRRRADRLEERESEDSTHIIDRYLLKEHIGFIFIGLAVAATLSVMVDLLQTLDRYLRVKPPFGYILEHFVYKLPADLNQGLPIVMLVATIFLFLTLARHHELDALKAAGVSVYRVAAPILLLGMLVTVGAGLFQEMLLPVLNERGDEVDRVKIRGQLPRHLQSRQRLWLRTSDTRFYRVEVLAPGSSDLYGVTVLEVERDFRLRNRLDARRAHWSPAGWELSDGAVRDISNGGAVETVPFTWTAMDLSETIDDFLKVQKPVNAMSYRELSEYIARLEGAGFQVKKYVVELYSKLSYPLMNVVMVLVAIPLSLQAPRGGRLFGIALAIGIMATYMVVHYVAIAFARADLLPPLVAAWTANVIFAGIGVSMFLRSRT